MEKLGNIIEKLISSEYTIREKYKIYEEAVAEPESILTPEEIEEAKQTLPSTDEETRNKMYAAMKIARKLNEIDPAIMIEFEKIGNQINREEEIKEQFEKADQDFSNLLGSIKNMTEEREKNKETKVFEDTETEELVEELEEIEEEKEENETHEEGMEPSSEEPEELSTEDVEELVEEPEELSTEDVEELVEEPEELSADIQEEKREIEKIEAKIIENYNISLELTKEFVDENTQLVKEKLIDYINNKITDENKKQSHLDRLNSENLTSEEIITVMQSEKMLEDNQFIISIIEEELKKEVKDDDKEQEIENIERQIEEIDREIENIKNSTQEEGQPEDSVEEKELEEEIENLNKELQEEQEKLALFNLDINIENKEEIINIVKEELENEKAKIPGDTLTIGRELGEKRTRLISELNKLNNPNITEEELLAIIKENKLEEVVLSTRLENEIEILSLEIQEEQAENGYIPKFRDATKEEIVKYCDEIIEIAKNELKAEIEKIPGNTLAIGRELGEKRTNYQQQLFELEKLQKELNNSNLSYDQIINIMNIVNKDNRYNLKNEMKEIQIKSKTEKLEIIKEGKDSINNNIENYQQQIEEIKQQIEEIKKGKSSPENNDEKLKELEEKKRQLEEKLKKLTQPKNSKLEEQLNKFKEHDNKDLNEIKNAYITIRDNIISDLSQVQDFTNKEALEQISEIASKIENHQLRSALKKYSNEEKLVQELAEDIYNALNKKKEKPKKDEKKWYKSLAFWGGAITGLGLSFAVQPGTGGLILAGARLAYAGTKKAIKVYSEKHEGEDTVIMNIIEGVKNKKEDFKEKHPNISSFVGKINDFFKKTDVQYFLNGVAAGYTVGKLGQAIANKFPQPGGTQPTGPSDPHRVEWEWQRISDGVGIGDTVDARGLMGFENSLGQGKTSIIEELAKEATIEKERNGFYHLVDKFGGELGWYKISDIEQNTKVLIDKGVKAIKVVK